MGQKNKITRRWAKRGTRPSAPHDQRTQSAYIFGAICPRKGKGAGLVMPWCDTQAMTAHLAEISAAVEPGAHAVLSHLALIGSAVKLRLHETGGAAAIVGTKADRARRGVRAVYGWRALLAAMWDCGRLGRIFSSRKSVLSDAE